MGETRVGVNGTSSGPVRTVIFFREGGYWYPLDLPLDDDLDAHARCNPGTVRIEDVVGRVLWPVPCSSPPAPKALKHGVKPF